MKAKKSKWLDKIDKLPDEEILKLERKLYMQSILMSIFGVICFIACISMFLSLVK